ncbi:MAG: NAD+ synthase [Candidatus Caenarcaniphilales bacterium]|nr:NAD+ synthase [Candidatus Caenarcaniphilales bacterium]
MKTDFKFALAQINPTVGDLKGNAEKIINIVKKHQNPQPSLSGGCNLIVFPELSLLGYPPKDLLTNHAFLHKAQTILKETIVPQISIPTLIGTVTQCKDKKLLYNSAVFIKDKQVQKVFHKKLLPNYEVFFESRYFQSGKMDALDDLVLDLNSQKIAVFICEDLLSVDSFESHYPESPVVKLSELTQEANQKIDFAVCLSASPFRINHLESRIGHAKSTARRLKCPVALVNQVGANDDLLFDGSSFLVDEKGELVILAKKFEEDVLIMNLTPKPSPLMEMGESSVRSRRDEVFDIKQALILGIKDYFRKTGFKKALLGLSGGIDSALVAYLATEALGPENVTGVMMPTIYSSEGSINDSEILIKNLGINKKLVRIQPVLEAYLEETNLQSLTLTEENLQSRIRGSTLMALANQESALVLATGNKSEFSVGYSTLYGDMCGALAPIGDLYKTQVWELAKICEGIPPQIITKPPSAELRPDQLDSDSLPDYKVLDEILKCLIDYGMGTEEIIKKGFKTEEVLRVQKLLAMAEFKRRQAPIILKVSNHAFGSGWMRPVAAGY